ARRGPCPWRGLREKLEQPDPGGETALPATFHHPAESLKRRSLVVILSALFDDPADLVSALKHFRHKKHEVIVFQILDPAEIDFPFDDITRIEDMENRREVTSDPRAFRRAYLDELGRFLVTIQSGCRTAQIDYVVAQTDQRFDLFLGTYLARRQALIT